LRRWKAPAPATDRTVGKGRAPDCCFGQWCQASKPTAKTQTVSVFDGRTALGTIEQCPRGRYRAVTADGERVSGCFETPLLAARALPGRPAP
jgi:hypothetical protein